MKLWKEHPALRIVLIAVFFVLGMALVIGGWKLTGQLKGLGIMIVGIILLLLSLTVYNQRFQ